MPDVTPFVTSLTADIPSLDRDLGGDWKLHAEYGPVKVVHRFLLAGHTYERTILNSHVSILEITTDRKEKEKSGQDLCKSSRVKEPLPEHGSCIVKEAANVILPISKTQGSTL